MKLKTYIFSVILLSGTLSAPCQDFRGAFHIEQKDFSERDDSLHIAFDLTIDARAVPTCTAMIFEPEIRDDNDNTQIFPYIQLNGKQRARLNKRWFAICNDKWLAAYQAPYLLVNTDKYTGETITYAFSVPYRPWMDSARLILKQETMGCAGEQHLYTYTLSNKIKTALREPQPRFALATPKDETKIRNRQGSAYLDFQVGRSVILPDYRRNPAELAKINEAMAEVLGDKDSRVTGLFIEGYASPEGSYSSNDRLARERSIALKDYLRNRYAMGENMFTVKSVAEDWDGLKQRVESSDLPQKDRVLAIINSDDAPDAKERKLKTLSIYGRLLRDIFPDLRRVEYQIDYAVRNYSTAEARDLIHRNPANLSHAELYRLAESYGKDSPEYRRILTEVIPRYYADDAVALNNAAALLLEAKEINTAIRMLEKATGLPAAWNNLGAAYLLQGNVERAKELLKQAETAGVIEALHNLKECEKIKARQ